MAFLGAVVVLLGLVAPSAALRVAAIRSAVSTRVISTIRMADQNFDFGHGGGGEGADCAGKGDCAATCRRGLHAEGDGRRRLRHVRLHLPDGERLHATTCGTCGYQDQMAKGAGMTAPPNTPFELLGASWVCPKCKSPKAFFKPTTIEIAGFEENQSFGIGTNTWTEGQKSNAIFGGLAFFFVLLMSGYALN